MNLNKILPIAAVLLLLASTFQTTAFAATATNSTSPIQMKTYSDYGLGFKMQIPSDVIVVNRGNDNVTLRNPGTFYNSSHLKVIVSVGRYGTYSSQLDLSYPPSLDDLARHYALLLASSNSNNQTLTNKTKLVVGNGTIAYLFQGETTLNNTANHSQKTVFYSIYLILSDNLVYNISFSTSNQTKFLSIEREIMKSFRFI